MAVVYIFAVSFDKADINPGLCFSSMARAIVTEKNIRTYTTRSILEIRRMLFMPTLALMYRNRQYFLPSWASAVH